MTENLVSNLTQKIEESKEFLQEEIKKSENRIAKKYEAQIESLTEELKYLKAKQEELESKTALSSAPSVSPPSDPNSLSLSSLQKKARFDFTFLNERLSQVQKGFQKGLIETGLSITNLRQELDGLKEEIKERRSYNNISGEIGKGCHSIACRMRDIEGIMEGLEEREREERGRSTPCQLQCPLSGIASPGEGSEEAEEDIKALDLELSPRPPTLKASALSLDEVSFEVDEEGYLRDKTGEYVLDDQGLNIKLSEQEIKEMAT